MSYVINITSPISFTSNTSYSTINQAIQAAYDIRNFLIAFSPTFDPDKFKFTITDISYAIGNWSPDAAEVTLLQAIIPDVTKTDQVAVFISAKSGVDDATAKTFISSKRS